MKYFTKLKPNIPDWETTEAVPVKIKTEIFEEIFNIWEKIQLVNEFLELIKEETSQRTKGVSIR